MGLLCIAIWLLYSGGLPRTRGVLDQLGKMGHREIARSYAACTRILLSAGGGGLVTAGTVVLKFLIVHSPLALVTGAALSAVNFISSFLIMQLVGFRLATKLSPLLGAALGRRWQELRELWRGEVAWTARTQAFSAAGNFLFVIPAAFVFHFIYRYAVGAPFLDAQTARDSLASLDPWHTGSLAYAALTGALLWLCTYLGGTIAHSSRPFSKATATTWFNVCLGALLAGVPLLGKLTGLPIDVRHFTLSGGMAAISTASLGPSAAWQAGLGPALAGVLMIGALNFSVSFALAFVAARLRGRGRSGGGLPVLGLPLEALAGE